MILINKMDMVKKCGMMDLFMKATIMMEKKKEKENIYIPIVIFLKEIIKIMHLKEKKVICSNERSYEVDWENNKMKGNVIFIWPDEKKYEGKFLDDKKSL